MKCYFGAHIHVSGNEKNNPSNVIDPYNFNPMDQALNNNIKSTLNLHNCQSIADYINLIKIDFMSGIAVARALQAEFTLQSEKQIYNAMSHHTYMGYMVNLTKYFFKKITVRIFLKINGKFLYSSLLESTLCYTNHV